MRNTVNRNACLRLLLTALLVGHAGCSALQGPKSGMRLTGGNELQTDAAAAALREDLVQFIEHSEGDVMATANEIEAATQETEVRKAALLWKVNLIQRANEALIEREPIALLFDSWAFCAQQVEYLQQGDGRELFKDQQSLAVAAAARMRTDIEAIAREHVPADKLPDMIRKIESHVRANPIRGVFAGDSVKSFSASDDGESLLTKVIGSPWRAFQAGQDALDPTTRLSESVDRFTLIMEDYPSLVRWQAQLLLLSTLDAPAIQSTVRGIESVSESSVRLATVAEELPTRVREEMKVALDDFVAYQPELRQTIEDTRATVEGINEALERAVSVSATIERSFAEMSRAGEIWETTAEAVTVTAKQLQQFKGATQESEMTPGVSEGEKGAGSNRNKFDINDYTRTAEAAAKTTAEIRALLAELRVFLDGDTLEKHLSRIDALTESALGQTATQADGVVDHITWRAVQLCALTFVLAIIYRLVATRVLAKRPP